MVCYGTCAWESCSYNTRGGVSCAGVQYFGLRCNHYNRLESRVLSYNIWDCKLCILTIIWLVNHWSGTTHGSICCVVTDSIIMNCVGRVCQFLMAGYNRVLCCNTCVMLSLFYSHCESCNVTPASVPSRTCTTGLLADDFFQLTAKTRH